MVDAETLMRLIDECKEEEDRLQVLNNEEEKDVQEQIDKQRQQTQNQLEKFNKVQQVFESVDNIADQA